jgi:hypothetical protein
LIAFKENEAGEVIWMTTSPFIYINQRKPSPSKVSVSFTKKELKGFTGTYSIGGSTYFVITSQNDKLLVSVNNGIPSELIAKSKTSFFSPENNATIRFLENATEIDFNGNTLKCTKIN